MRLFIWQNVSRVTDREHDGGGLAVLAPSLERAHALIAEATPSGTYWYDGTPYHCGALDEPPDFECGTDADGERVWVFENAGCC